MTNRQLSWIQQHRENVLPVVLAGVCLLTAVFGDAGREALRYERQALEAGQWWRVFSAHFVHLNTIHTLLNLAGLGLLAALFRRELEISDWIGAGLFAACGIAAGLYFLDPDTDWYVGLSGMLHGWFVIGAVRVAERERGFGLVLLGALVAKLAYEQFLGTMPSTAALDVGPVVVAAHLYGAAAAGLYYITTVGRRLVGRSQPRL